MNEIIYKKIHKMFKMITILMISIKMRNNIYNILDRKCIICITKMAFIDELCCYREVQRSKSAHSL